MRWPWRLRRAIEPKTMVSRAQELETAKEILAEVFHPPARRGGGDYTVSAGGERARGERGRAVTEWVLPTWIDLESLISILYLSHHADLEDDQRNLRWSLLDQEQQSPRFTSQN
jgi:hypothetical protein